MEHAVEHLRKGLTHALHIAERDGRLVQLAVLDLSAHELADHLRDAVGRGIGHGAHGCLDGIGHHQHGSLARLRLGPVVAEVLDVRLLAAGFERLVVEVEHRRVAVVLTDQVDDRGGQAVFLSQRRAVAHVRDEDLRRHLRLGVVVRVLAHLILLEVVGPLELADVVVVCAHSHEQRVRADGLCGGLGDVGDDDRVVIGARRLDHQPAQKRLIGIGQLQQLGGRHQVECSLQQRLNAHADDGGHKAAQRGEERAIEHGLNIVVRQNAHAQYDTQIAYAHEQAGDEQAHARSAPAQRIDA